MKFLTPGDLVAFESIAQDENYDEYTSRQLLNLVKELLNDDKMLRAALKQAIEQAGGVFADDTCWGYSVSKEDSPELAAFLEQNGLKQ